MRTTVASRAKRNLRAVILIHNRRDTGPYHKVIELANAVSAAGVSVTVMCTSPTARFYKHERLSGLITIVEMPDLLWGRLRQGLDPWNTLRRTVWMIRHRPDVVHAIDCRPAVILPAMAVRALGAALVISWWDLLGRGRERSGHLYAASLGWIESAFERRFRKYADFATVISRYLGDELVRMGYPRERIVIQRLGCDSKGYQPIEIQNARRQLNLPADGVILCYVGNLFPGDKELLLQALREVRNRNESRFQTILIGSTGVRDEIATELEITQIARQTPDAVHRYICASDLCLLPGATSDANRAKWPSKCGDYFNAGRPVVASPISDLPELFARDGLGYLASDGSAEAFAEALLKALSKRNEWPAIGARCRRFAETELNTTALGKKLVEVYQGASEAKQA